MDHGPVSEWRVN